MTYIFNYHLKVTTICSFIIFLTIFSHNFSDETVIMPRIKRVPREIKKEKTEVVNRPSDDSSDDGMGEDNSLNTVYGLKLEVSKNKLLI